MLIAMKVTTKIARPVGSCVGRTLLTVEKFALKVDELFMIKLTREQQNAEQNAVSCLVGSITLF